MATPHAWPWTSSQNDVYEEMQRLRAMHEREAHELKRQAQLGLVQLSDNTAGLKSGSSAAAARVQSSPVPNPVLILCPLS